MRKLQDKKKRRDSESDMEKKGKWKTVSSALEDAWSSYLDMSIEDATVCKLFGKFIRDVEADWEVAGIKILWIIWKIILAEN